MLPSETHTVMHTNYSIMFIPAFKDTHIKQTGTTDVTKYVTPSKHCLKSIELGYLSLTFDFLQHVVDKLLQYLDAALT